MMGGADRTESRRRPSLSLIASLQAEKNILNAVCGNEDDGSRRRRPASRQQPLSNSFTSSKQNVIDNPSGDSAAGHGKKGGLFQFRRRTMLDEHDADAQAPYSVSNFQQTFHEVKTENPTASMGAVKIMTMRRLSEQNQLKKGEQDQLRRLVDETEDEKEIGLAAKTFNKFVDTIRAGASDECDDQNIKRKMHWNRSPLNDSFDSASSGEKDGGLLSFNSFRRKSSAASGPARRASQDNSVGPLDFNASNESLHMRNEIISKARTANEMYAIAANEQGENMAPRRSIGDFTALLSVGDQSEDTRRSLSSELSGLLLEELAKSIRSEEKAESGHKNDNGTSDDGSSRDNYSGSAIEAFEIYFEDSAKHFNEQLGAEDGNNAMDQWIDTQFEKVASRIASSIENSQRESSDLNCSRHSDSNRSATSGLSGFSDCTSMCADGLIVGFRPRKCSDESKVDEDHLKAGNFASDFSAWERRR